MIKIGRAPWGNVCHQVQYPRSLQYPQEDFYGVVLEGGADDRVAYWQQEVSGEVSRRLNDPSGESDTRLVFVHAGGMKSCGSFVL